MQNKNTKIAETLLEGFQRHYSIFQRSNTEALRLLKKHQWNKIQKLSQDRIDYYETRAQETKSFLESKYSIKNLSTKDWSEIKTSYINLLHEIKQPELAETFFNTVVCRLLNRKYYNNKFIFFRPTISTEYITSRKPTYFSYRITRKNMLSASKDILKNLSFDKNIESLKKEIKKILRYFKEIKLDYTSNKVLKLDVLSSLFIRNKGGYIITRVAHNEQYFPLIFALVPTTEGQFKIDAVLHKQEQLVVLFSFSRSYFFTETDTPSSFVGFIGSLLPNKPKAEIYSAIGLHKHGKTLFYRSLFDHLRHSTEQFIEAKGVRGLVMIVLTLPSFPYVFKIIRDKFGSVKDITRDGVRKKYHLVKKHDRVGRLADTMEFKDVAIPANRFDRQLLSELANNATLSVIRDGDQLVFKHVYIERRMLPLNIHVEENPITTTTKEIIDYGQAVKDLAAVNIFPGDLLLKNFGVTKYGKVVFYDYDEIALLTNCNFKKVPSPKTPEDEMSNRPWYPVRKNDVLPETWEPFLIAKPELRKVFKKLHSDIFDPEYWRSIQKTIFEGEIRDIFPYDESIRLK